MIALALFWSPILFSLTFGALVLAYSQRKKKQILKRITDADS